MAKIEIDTDKWFIFRKDIMSSTFLSLPSKIILTSLISRKRESPLKSHINIIQKFFALTENEIEYGFNELNKLGLINNLEHNETTYTCVLNAESVDYHFKGSIRK